MSVTLTGRELEIMNVLWLKGSGTVAEVREQLPADLAYTTVLSLIRTMEEKGYLRHETSGRAHRTVIRPMSLSASVSAGSRASVSGSSRWRTDSICAGAVRVVCLIEYARLGSSGRAPSQTTLASTCVRTAGADAA